MPPIYTAVATAEGRGRDGRVSSADGVLGLDLASPVELGGPGGAANPELLFAAGYAACFHAALLHCARRRKLRLEGTTVTAEVGLEMHADGRFALSASLSVDIPGVDPSTARELLELADQACPYSNALRGNVEVALELAAQSTS